MKQELEGGQEEIGSRHPLAGLPFGAVLAGVVVQRAGLIPTIVGMGALYLLVPLGMFLNRSLRQMDAPPAAGAR